MRPLDETNCRPGDITVTAVHRGFMIGRALQQRGPGPWWQYIVVVNGFREAVDMARELATTDQVNAWVVDVSGEYTAIPLDPATPFERPNP